MDHPSGCGKARSNIFQPWKFNPCGKVRRNGTWGWAWSSWKFHGALLHVVYKKHCDLHPAMPVVHWSSHNTLQISSHTICWWICWWFGSPSGTIYCWCWVSCFELDYMDFGWQAFFSLGWIQIWLPFFEVKVAASPCPAKLWCLDGSTLWESTETNQQTLKWFELRTVVFLFLVFSQCLCLLVHCLIHASHRQEYPQTFGMFLCIEFF